MSYTPQQRRLIVDALQKAKPFLWNGKNLAEHGWTRSPRKVDAICQAIMAAETARGISANTRVMVCKMIAGRLQIAGLRVIWMPTWLLNNGVSAEELRNTECVQAHRLAWMDRLIEEFSDEAG